MRARAIPALFGVSALAIASALMGAGTASAASGPVASTSGGSTDAADRVLDGPACKGGANLGAPNGDGVTAQNFEAAFDAYDAYGGADFKLKKKCKVASVYIEGQGAAATAIYVAVVGNAGGLPDKENVKCEKTINATGPIFKVPFKCKLGKGTYSLIAQGTAEFATLGQWFWSTTNEGVLSGDAWKNPGGGFGAGCTDWDLLATCLAFPDYEYIFALQKKVS